MMDPTSTRRTTVIPGLSWEQWGHVSPGDAGPAAEDAGESLGTSEMFEVFPNRNNSF